MTVGGARKEIWAYGLRNPHRLIWDVNPASALNSVEARAKAATLLAFSIGLVTWETVVVIHRGASYGYPLREGTQMMTPDGMAPIPENDNIPVRISDTVVRGSTTPKYPVLQYPTRHKDWGDAIAGGFVYRGELIPALRGKLVFGDITTGRIWYANRADVLAADDGDPKTIAPMFEIATILRRLVEQAYRERGGETPTLPGMGVVSGPGRVDVRFAEDHDGELYLLTKADGVIRKVVGARETTAPAPAAPAPTPGPGRTVNSQPPGSITNPAAPTPESIAAGKRACDANCAACHGNLAQGAVKAGVTISILEEQKGRQPPDLTDEQWDHGSSDGEIFTVIKRGLPPTMMAGYDANRDRMGRQGTTHGRRLDRRQPADSGRQAVHSRYSAQRRVPTRARGERSRETLLGTAAFEAVGNVVASLNATRLHGSNRKPLTRTVGENS